MKIRALLGYALQPRRLAAQVLATSRRVVSAHAPAVMQGPLRVLWGGLRQAWQSRRPPQHLFVFGGRTHYWPGMGRELYAQEPAFRQTVQECERILTQELDAPSVLAYFTESRELVDGTDEPQIILCSLVLQLALVAVWQAHGVQPQAMLGISLGEAAAVHAAGGLSLLDALRIGCIRLTVSEREQKIFRVLVIEAGINTAGPLVARCPVELDVVLVLSEHSCLLLCAEEFLQAAEAFLMQQEIAYQLLATATVWPYHTRRLGRHLSTSCRILEGLQPQPLVLPCYMASVGRLVPAGTVLGVEFWVNALRNPVRISALQAALADQYTLLTPIGANPFPFIHRETPSGWLGASTLLESLRPNESGGVVVARVLTQLKAARLVRTHPVEKPSMTPAVYAANLQLGSTDMLIDPHAASAYLRHQGPLHFLPREQCVLVLDAELISEILHQPKQYSSLTANAFDNALLGADLSLCMQNRTVLQSFFAAKELTELQSYTEAMVEHLEASVRIRPAFDFITEFSLPLAQAVGARLLGLSEEEGQELQRQLPGHSYSFDHFPKLQAYFTAYFKDHQPQLGYNSLLDHLQAMVQQNELSLPEALTLTISVWLAGGVVSSRLMSTCAYYLLTYPHVAEQLRQEPALVEVFVEEMLRLEPPINLVARVTTQAVRLAGQSLPANTHLICWLAAATRDLTHYPHLNKPELHRRPSHQPFVNDTHVCMGSYLARIETQTVVKWLLDPGSSLRLLNPFQLPSYYPNSQLRTLSTLPVTLNSPIQA